MSTVLITGGTGLIGKALTKELLRRQNEVIVLSRNKNQISGHPGLSYAYWNVEAQEVDQMAVHSADYIVHLAGANVADKRWTRERKGEIVNSRVKSTALLYKALAKYPDRLKAFISASATGWYDIDPQIPNPFPFEEHHAPAKDFLGITCQQWESSVDSIKTLEKRVVKFRTGIVLSNEGGALPAFKKAIRVGVTPVLASGRQIVSWIHEQDLIQLYITAIENENLEGAYNAVAPHPVSHKKIMQGISQHNHKPFIPFYVPAFMLTLMLGEMSIELLKSVTVSSKKIQESGFTFQFPTIEEALGQLLNNNKK